MPNDFQDFINSCKKDLLENQRARIEKTFDGQFSFDELTGKAIVEARNTTIEYLQAYHNWLTQNYEIYPKKK